MLRDFSEGKLTNNLYKSSDVLGRNSRASMDYYNQQSKLKGNSLSIGIENLAVNVLQFKHMIKYIRSELAKNSNSIKRLSTLCSSTSLH